MKLNTGRFILYTITILAVFLFANIFVKQYVLQKHKARQLSNVQNGLSYARSELEADFAANFLLLHSIASYISVHPDFKKREFQKLAKTITSRPNSLINIAVAPDYVLTYVYPEKGNEKIIGVDYRTLPNQLPKVELAVKSKAMVIDGPISLIQGGKGIIGRSPVYIEKGGEQVFWGLVSSVINFDFIMGRVKEIADDFGISISVRDIDNEKDTVVYGDKDIFNHANAVLMDVAVPSGHWQITAMPVNGWVVNEPFALYIDIFAVLAAAVSIFLVYSKLKKDYSLAESEKRFRDYTISSSDWVWEIDENNRYTYTSGKVKEILGYSPEEFVGKSPFDFMKKEEAERVKTLFQNCVSARKPIDDMENWHVGRDGQEVCVLTSGVPIFNINGTYKGYRGVDKDITDRKKWEDELSREKEHTKQIIEGTTDAFFELDNKLNIIYINKRAELQLGVTGSSVIGKSIIGIIPKSQNDVFHNKINKALKNQAVADFEMYYEQGENWYEVHVYPSPERLSVYFHNISARKFLQQSLEYAKNELELFFETTRDGIVIMDTNTNFLHCNRSFLKMTGYSYKEILKKSCLTMTIQEEIEKSKDAIKHVIEYGYIENFEKRCIINNGEEINVQMSISLMPDKKRMLAATRDISELVKARTSLSESKKLLDLFFTSSLDGFFFMMLDEPIFWNDDTDKDKTLDYVFEHQRITRINEAMLKQYLAKESDFIGLTPSQFFEHDMEHGRAVWAQLFDEGKLHVDTIEKRFDGSEMVINGDYKCLYDDEGRITGHFGVQRDVTKERDSEEKLERYVNIVDENVINSQTDLDGIITYASKAFCDISGYSKEELIGQNHNIIHHPDMPAEIFTDLWNTITTGVTWHGEIKNLKKDGGFYWVDTFVSPLVNRSGETYGYMAVRQDITAKKEIEKISVTDRLTGIFNRVKLDKVIKDEHHRFERYSEVYSIVLFDIDHFKSVNDTHGHLVGDYVLQELAVVTQKNLRETDIFGRWGGEEFLVICPHTDEPGATMLAEKIRESIESHPFDHVKKITASFGVASINMVDGYNSLFKSVDDALYEAKKTGRNKVCSVKA